ncbi:hypothetical protein Selin_1472 [Desulfurispirillum indicum S5]|uniref:Uncharacterized protein n=1 Tax=Desulfurispirillum indicum (strain ATCC BAA-1389 / DSM 22839 / S5) TaxID=653733 RepID=E6W6W3_DESIS|nr:hypothetical protein [Desulfurispirillum indicum]ADU66206.1 hypothetical protein Selin_1472 [Desulfurispirillum indicum S5]
MTENKPAGNLSITYPILVAIAVSMITSYAMTRYSFPEPPFTSVMVIDSSSFTKNLRQSYVDGAISEEQLREQLRSLNQRVQGHVSDGALVLEKSAVVGGPNVRQIN